MPATDWKARVTSLDATNSRGETLVVDWMPGMDKYVALDLGDRVDVGEELLSADVSVKLWRLHAFGDAADTDQSNKMVGSPIVAANLISVRLAALDPGYWYRLAVLFGAVGNRRGAGLLIHSWE